MNRHLLRHALLACWSLCALPANLSAQDVAADEQDKTLAEFEDWATAYLADPSADVLLPENWFEAQFSTVPAKQLRADYEKLANRIKSLPALIAAQQAKGNTELVVSRCRTPIDRQATGYQNAALQQMKSPTPLFALRMVKPGAKKGFALASFVYVQGRFCYAGKFGALNPRPRDLVAELLCTMPLEMLEPMLQEQGLIKGSAEDYLKQVGVLK